MIFEIDYESEDVNIVAEFKDKLKRQPDYFVMGSHQSSAIVATSEDALLYNIKDKTEIDLDDMHQITALK
jgi:hypothetical protein